MIDFYGPGDGDCSGNFTVAGHCIDYIYDLPLSQPERGRSRFLCDLCILCD